MELKAFLYMQSIKIWFYQSCKNYMQEAESGSHKLVSYKLFFDTSFFPPQSHLNQPHFLNSVPLPTELTESEELL